MNFGHLFFNLNFSKFTTITSSFLYLQVHNYNNMWFGPVNQGRICFCYQLNCCYLYRGIPYGASQKPERALKEALKVFSQNLKK